MERILRLYRSRTGRFWISFLLSFIAVFIVSCVSLDPDFGWHYQTGTYILKHGFPTFDVFSYTATHFVWISHEWLNDIITSILFNTGGKYLAVFVYSIIWALGFTLATRRFEPAVVLLSTASLIDFVMVRPSAWSLLFFILSIWILESKRKEWILWYPLLMILWVNIHGSFLIGLFLILFYKVIHKEPIPWPVVIASFAATFVNPYGPRLYHEVFSIVLDSKLHHRISEWRSFAFPIFFLSSGALLMAIFFVVEKKYLQKKYLLSSLLLVASISSLRYYLFFLSEFSRHLESTFQEFKTIFTNRFDRRTMIYFFTAIPTIMIGYSVAQMIIHPELHFPEQQAIDYLNTHPCPGNMFNMYNYGGYLIWKVPHQPVFIDGRMPSWKVGGTDFFGVYDGVLASTTYRDKVFNHYNIKCVVYDNDNSPFITNMKKSGWPIVLELPNTLIFEKPTSTLSH